MLDVADVPVPRASRAESRRPGRCRQHADDTVRSTTAGAGSDLVVHSATKLLSGHSDVVLGAAVAAAATARRVPRCVGADHWPARSQGQWRRFSLCVASVLCPFDTSALAATLPNSHTDSSAIPVWGSCATPGLPGRSSAHAPERSFTFGSMVSFEVAGAGAAEAVVVLCGWLCTRRASVASRRRSSAGQSGRASRHLRHCFASASGAKTSTISGPTSSTHFARRAVRRRRRGARVHQGARRASRRLIRRGRCRDGESRPSPLREAILETPRTMTMPAQLPPLHPRRRVRAAAVRNHVDVTRERSQLTTSFLIGMERAGCSPASNSASGRTSSTMTSPVRSRRVSSSRLISLIPSLSPRLARESIEITMCIAAMSSRRPELGDEPTASR